MTGIAMTETLNPTSLEASGLDPLIEDGVSHRLAVGRYTLLIHPEHGAIVQATSPGQPAIPKLRLLTSEELPRIPEPEIPVGPRERSPLALLPNDEKHLLASLAAVGGGPVGSPHLIAVAGVPDPAPALKELLDQGLIQAESLRYSLTGNLAEELPRSWDLKDWRDRALTHFLAWSEANPSAVSEETGAMCCLVEHASRSGLHAETLRLGRALEHALLVSGRWNGWAETLERIHAAAQGLKDRKAEAWALHQLGTRAFCLDDRTTASDRLTQALEIRESIGDREGAAVTFHNMGLLLGPKALAEVVEEPSKRGLPHLLFWILLPVLAMVFGAFLASRSFNRTAETEPDPAAESSSAISEEPAPPVAILEEGEEEEEEPLVTDPTPPLLTTEPLVSEPLPQPEIPDTAPEPVAEPESPELAFTSESLDFGEVPLLTASKTLEIAISNTGNVPMVIDEMAVRGPAAADFQPDGRCVSVEIAPGDECRFEIVFTPTETGRRNARLVMSSREPRMTRRVALSGEGGEEE